MNNSSFKTLVYQRDEQLPATEDAVFLTLVDRAIANVRPQLKTFEPNLFEQWLTNVTIPSTGYTIPDDAVYAEEQVLIYPPNSEGKPVLPYPDQSWRYAQNKWYVDNYDRVDIVYQRDIPRLKSAADGVADEDVFEFPFKKRKSEEILVSETMALIYQWHEENERTESAQNALQQSDRIR